MSSVHRVSGYRTTSSSTPINTSWKWSEQYPEWRLAKLKIDINDIKEEVASLLTQNFKDYHGTKYMSLLYHDEKFGKFTTQIKIMRNKGLPTVNRKIMKHHLKRRY